MISAANEAGDRNNPTNAVQIRLRASLMGQKDCVILPQLSARLGLRQGQVDASSTDGLGEKVTVPSLPEITDCHA